MESTLELSRLAAAGSERGEEAAWIAAARNGDRSSFEELVRRHQVRVFRLAGRFYTRREDVEDAAQETFLTAWSKLHTYRARAPFEHWLTRVCLNVCYQRLRKRSEESMPEEAEPVAQPTDPTARFEAARLLARLPAPDRFVLVLLHGEGWSTAEIAGHLGWSRSKVKVRAHRARRRLRRLVEEGA